MTAKKRNQTYKRPSRRGNFRQMKIVKGRDIPREKIQLTMTYRGGIVPIYWDGKKILFGMGVDKRTGELTDFGGGIKIKKESLLRGILREFTEETGNIFKGCVRDIRDLYSTVAVRCEQGSVLFIVFLPISKSDFEQSMKMGIDTREISGIVWLDILRYFHESNKENSPKIWSRISPILRQSVKDPELHLIKGLNEASSIQFCSTRYPQYAA